MGRFLSDETIGNLLKKAVFIEDYIMIALCNTALYGCPDARNQISKVFLLIQSDPETDPLHSKLSIENYDRYSIKWETENN